MKRLVTTGLSLVIVLVSVLVVQPAAADGGQEPANDSASWYGEYFDNQFMVGSPAFSRRDGSLAFNWGHNAPGNGMPADNFAIRWGTDPYFQAGTYRFSILADDGVAVTLDFQNTLVNTLDVPKPGQTYTVDVMLSEGRHHIQVDFREYGGLAYIYVNWVKLNATGQPQPNPNPTLPGNVAAAYVNTGRLNMRSGPSLQHNVQSVLVRNTVVSLIGRNNDASWVKVALSGNQSVQGWVSSRYVVANINLVSLAVVSGGSDPQFPVSAGGVVNTGALNMRSGPGIDYGVMGTLQRDQSVYLQGRNLDASWLLVQDSNGQKGWVRASYIRTTAQLSILPVVSSSQQYITHVVQPGENLFRIALRYGVNWQALAIFNGINDSRLVYVGQIIRVPVS